MHGPTYASHTDAPKPGPLDREIRGNNYRRAVMRCRNRGSTVVEWKYLSRNIVIPKNSSPITDNHSTSTISGEASFFARGNSIEDIHSYDYEYQRGVSLHSGVPPS